MAKTKVIFKTNLDEVKKYLCDLNSNWEGDIYPVNGDRIAFDKYGTNEFVFELEVKSISFKNCGSVKEIELHVPSYYGTMTLNTWIEWFKRH